MTFRFEWILHKGGVCRPERMREVLRAVSWGEVSGLPPEDLFELARRYQELRWCRRNRPGTPSSMDGPKEDEVRENLHDMLKAHLRTHLARAREEDLKIRIRVTRDSISIVGVGARPNGRDPKNERAPGSEQEGVPCAC